jgi:hypothetical protein
MREEIDALFGPGLSETTVIPNGIDTDGWPFAPRRAHGGPAELLPPSTWVAANRRNGLRAGWVHIRWRGS